MDHGFDGRVLADVFVDGTVDGGLQDGKRVSFAVLIGDFIAADAEKWPIAIGAEKSLSNVSPPWPIRTKRELIKSRDRETSAGKLKATGPSRNH